MGNGGKYLDFRKSWLYIKVKIIKLDGMVYVNLEKRGIINLIFKCCFFKLMFIWIEKNVFCKMLIIIYGKFILMYLCLLELVFGFVNVDIVI